MAHSYVERELKFDVPPDFSLPDLTGVLPTGATLDTVTEQLRSEYYDTTDHALLAAGMTLRRRSGTTDVGWQLKVPHAPFREEIRSDVGGEDVPSDLSLLLHGIVRGRELHQIASVTTERSLTVVLGADGRRLAEIADDIVHAAAAGDTATVSSWREVEVELGNDELELLYALGKRLRRAGARRSASSSKLARALPTEPAVGKATKGKLSAGQVITAYLAAQQQAMLAGDLALRRGDDTVIHPTRVATRRLRSTLRVFGALLDDTRSADLDAQLRSYAALLGEVRDRQVLRKRLDAMIAEVDDALLMGPVQARIDAELQREQTEHWRRLQAELNSDDYLTLLSDVASWVRQPPLSPKAARPAAGIRKLILDADRRVTKRLRTANATGDVHQLHAARKAAKRARYAAEAAEPVVGAKVARGQAKKYQKLQDLLGEHQDSLVSADFLRRLGAKAGTTQNENGFAYGVLHEREAQHAQAVRHKAQSIAKRYS